MQVETRSVCLINEYMEKSIMFNKAIILIATGFMILTFGCSKKVVKSEGVIGGEISVKQASESSESKVSSRRGLPSEREVQQGKVYRY